MPQDEEGAVTSGKFWTLLGAVVLVACIVSLLAVGTMTTILRWRDDRNDREALTRLAGLRRTAWVPQTKDEDGPLNASKFSGMPWLNPKEKWPACPNCGKRMQLFLQLNLKELPEHPRGCPREGLLQLFYCTTQEPRCEDECQANRPFSRSVLVRIIQMKGNGVTRTEKPLHDPIPARTITGWAAKDDYPDSGEMEINKVVLSNNQAEHLRASFPATGDKLLGWPVWPQEVEYPRCPDCHKPMAPLFQLDSDNNLAYSFGIAGCGHITQCPHHPSRLAFYWEDY
jgi:hypothetical protein